jgi:cytochrome c biogenesis protein CcdA
MILVERRYLVVLMLCGIVGGLYAAFTYQWVLMILIAALVVLILIAAEMLQQVRLLSEAITTGVADLEESMVSMEQAVEELERRLNDPGNR